ncbi:hypothetical protein IWW38_003651, partial [Coemansia aciculifera]
EDFDNDFGNDFDTDFDTPDPSPTQNRPLLLPPTTSRSRHTVVAVVTVVVDGSVSLSSETSVMEYTNGDGNGREEIGGVPYTSTITENGSVVVVTGVYGEPLNANSGAMPSVAGLSIKTVLSASAVAIVLMALC